MPPILTAEDVVKRIAAECAFINDRGAVGIQLKPAAAIVRQYGSNSASSAQANSPADEAPSPALIGATDIMVERSNGGALAV
jgi:hypothetical protein